MNEVVVISLLFFLIETGTGTRCLSCGLMPSTIECAVSRTCSTGQGCYAKYVLKTDGTVLYEFGCHSSQTCLGQNVTHALIGKRATGDIELCYKCCEGDMCNQGRLCTANSIPSDPCLSSPCVRGSCFSGNGNSPAFLCVCPSGFEGPYCETEINPCSPSPCTRGSCYKGHGNSPSFFCLCPSGFTGLHCETIITTTTATTSPIQTTTTSISISANPCLPSPCVRGDCFTGNGNNSAFLCLCPRGFEGTYCETLITTTTATTTPIQTTTESITIPANPCLPSPCVRGDCFTSNGQNPAFLCLCPSGFDGTYCETVITTTTTTTSPIQTTTKLMTSTVNPCSSSPCIRGSCFVGSGNNPTFVCLCPSDFTGLHCETDILTTVATTTLRTTSTTWNGVCPWFLQGCPPVASCIMPIKTFDKNNCPICVCYSGTYG